MNNKSGIIDIIRISASFLILAILISSAGCGKTTEYPNIVLIIADDVSPDFSCYNGQVNTPEIDKLAEQGVRFNNAYVTASSCSPSRNSIITGRYPHNTGAPELHMELPEGHFLFPKALKDAGYHCVLAGKWHMGEATRPAFDLIISENRQTDPTGSARWVECLENRPQNKPFFMWFASYDAHRPWQPDSLSPAFNPDSVIVPPGVPDTPAARQDVASYYNEIQRFDRYVGKVVKELKKQQVFNNTFIILLGDNGRPFPRNKTSLYEGGMKTPLIVHWPDGYFSPGSVSNSLISTTDIAPTLLEAVGLNIPARIQGISFLSVCRNPDTQIHKYITGERNWHVQRACGRMVRQDSFLYIRDFTPSLYSFQMVDYTKGSYAELLRLKKEGNLNPLLAETFSTNRAEELLFNILSDPEQKQNLASDPEHREILVSMRNILTDWQNRTGDSVPLLEEMTQDRHNRVTFERLFPGNRPPDGIIPGEKGNAVHINEK